MMIWGNAFSIEANVTGYITAFYHAAFCIDSRIDDGMLDHFIARCKPYTYE